MTDAAVQPFNQRIRFWTARAAMLCCAPLIVLASPGWGPGIRALLGVLGTLLVIAAVLYRFWAILYIGGRKNKRVVQDGPYSMSRHPLYFGTTLGAAGFGLMLGSLVLSALLGFLALVILSATARREERFLRSEFGAEYAEFASRVTHRIVPVPSLFHTPDEVSFRPRILRTNLMDALGFLVLIPLAEGLELLRIAGLGVAFPIY